MIIKRIRRAKLFVFLRQHRHEVFDETFQQELASLYQESQRGHPPVPPALLAMATILQSYTGVSDDEVIEASTMDRRWQLVLDCLDTEEPPFSKGTLIAFRKRLRVANMDRSLIDRTIEVARATGAFGSGPLRATLDSSPLWIEDIYNLFDTSAQGFRRDSLQVEAVGDGNHSRSHGTDGQSDYLTDAIDKE
jgi:transposase